MGPLTWDIKSLENQACIVKLCRQMTKPWTQFWVTEQTLENYQAWHKKMLNLTNNTEYERYR